MQCYEEDLSGACLSPRKLLLSESDYLRGKNPLKVVKEGAIDGAFDMFTVVAASIEKCSSHHDTNG
jgi:hypothetical protein